MLRYGVTIFLSAFLLFSVQLLLGKYILPWFGGVPSVWTTCMLFFQSLLLGGYAYAHWLAGRPSTRMQRMVHFTVVAFSLALLSAFTLDWGAPLLPGGDWKPAPDADPIGAILSLLAVAVGLPFLVLSATNPLLQAWFSAAHPDDSPYRLYALSNLGSLLGLLSYPLVVEVWLPLGKQAALWTIGYVAFAAGMAFSAWPLGRAAVLAARADAEPAVRPARVQVLLWLGLSGCGSVLLLATTNQMTQEIAVVPFLWMLPLAVYLLTFVLCFDDRSRYSRPLYLAALLPALALATVLLQHGIQSHVIAQIGILAVALFVACMACHGELARLKPHPRYLTAFYLAVTAGGALGGVFVGIIAPRLFPGMWELPIALWLTAALLLATLAHDRSSLLYRGPAASGYAALLGSLLLAGLVFAGRFAQTDSIAEAWRGAADWPIALLTAAAAVILLSLRRSPSLVAAKGGGGTPAEDRTCSGNAVGAGRRRTVTATMLAALLLFAAVQLAVITEPLAKAVAVSRTFYGVLAVLGENAADPAEHNYRLQHGRVLHGMQYRSPDRRRQPTAYYGPGSGIALVMTDHPKRRTGNLRVGVIGLGTGTLAAYGRAGDALRFYEINPEVVRLAVGPGSLFTYLSETPAAVEVALGDARIALERELHDSRPGGFDILAIDAFNSDAIPVHLLTREAFAIWLAHLADDGVLAIHVSNRYLDLRPVLFRLARHYRLDFADVVHETPAAGEWGSDWVLMSRRALAAMLPRLPAAAGDSIPRSPLWTDDYSNVLGALRFDASRPGRDAPLGCLVFECDGGDDDGGAPLGL
jgi:hypothetical protein